MCPTFSRDGGSVAFVWAGPTDQNADVYVKGRDDREPRRLTAHPSPDVAPAWSPDDRRVAFCRHHPAGSSIMVVPAAGGAEEEVFGVDEHVKHLDGSPSGEIVFALSRSKTHPPGVYLLNPAARALRRAVATPAGSADLFPRASPTGGEVAFVRQVGTYTEDQLLCVAAAAGGSEPRAVLRRKGFFRGVDWTADGAELIYSFDRSGRLGSGGSP